MDWVSANRGEIYQTSGSNERGSLEVNSTIKEESLQMSTLMFKHNISASPPLPGVCVLAQSFQSCPTLCNPRDYSPPGCCVHGILQARTLECTAISFSITRGLSRKKKSLQKKKFQEFPGGTVDQDSMLPMQETRVQSLVKGLKSCMPCSMAKNTIKFKKINRNSRLTS